MAGYRSRTRSPQGGYGIVFKKNLSNGQIAEVACGQCIGCRLDKSKEWAIRCVHEAQLHENNCFITLTYNEKNLPSDGSLVKEHFQKFMKRLRKQNQHKIRYYMCGEYGEKLTRPHYHALLFGHDFHDKIPMGRENKNQLYTSQTLEKIWGKGFTSIGEMTFQSAGYVARYALKKITGDAAYAHYTNEDGVLLQPEYTTMSRGRGTDKGIGYRWYTKYKHDLYPEDECVIDGRIMKPPRYYAKIYQQQEPQNYEQIKQNRKRFFGQHKEDATWQRLADRETVKKAQISLLTRQLER